MSAENPGTTEEDGGDNRRRTPRQERSQRRVAGIIEAAGQLLEDVGYVALTTNSIAKKAGTSIGSLYQFFPNKDAVIAELVKRFRHQIHQFFSHSLSVDLARRSITGFVDVVVDGIEAIREREPGFGSVFSFRRFGGDVDEQKVRMESDIIAPLDDLLAQAYPDVPADQRQRCMQVVAEASKVLASTASDETPETREMMREEMKKMLGLYVASYFTPDTLPEHLREAIAVDDGD